ncbi:MAG: hypothetical protein H7Y38_09590 [Armatimonadetes bacterium]|nr:hypothetical protein [Armatimonadota bacterium]
MNKQQIRQASDMCFLLGFLSVAGSIFTWFFSKRDGTPEGAAHGERFGIFVGLWAPTFLIVSNRLKGYADDMEEGKTLP